MDEQLSSKFPDEFNQALVAFCQSPAPEAAFTLELEHRLREKHAKLLQSYRPERSLRRFWRPFNPPLVRQKWQYALALLLVVMALVLLTLGPRRVLAQVQHWLGYVPNVGFVDFIDARILASPIEVSQAGVTLRVERVVASHSSTDVVFSNPGLTEQDLLWSNEPQDNSGFTAFLLLPDGTRLEMTKWEISVGSGKMEFPALPAGVYQLTLLVPRLPFVPAGALPENWEVPITLLPANGKLIKELFPEPYTPSNACDTRHGITLCIANVAQTSQETAVQYKFLWTNPDWWNLVGIGWEEEGRPYGLSDNLGHSYDEKMDSSGSSIAEVGVTVSEVPQVISASTVLSKTDMLVFPLLSLSASQATLMINSLEYQISAQGSFSLELGDNPQIGDAWPLDIHFETAGFQIHLTGASLQTKTMEIDDGKYKQYPSLVFDLDPIEAHDGISLRYVDVDIQNNDQDIHGTIGSNYANNGELTTYGELGFWETGIIPTGTLMMQVTGAGIHVDGPWEATWDIPGKASADVIAPVRLKPTPAASPDGEIQPVIQEMFLSDRLTAIQFGAINLPAGTTFSKVLPYTQYPSNPLTNPIKLYMEDNLGYRYPFGEYEVTLPPPENENNSSRWMYFDPMQLYAQSIRVHVPAVELRVDGQASFAVDVPQTPTFKAKNTKAIESGSGEPDHIVTLTSWATDPWPVDIRFNLAGYEVKLDKAMLVHDERSSAPYQLVVSGNTPNQIQSHMDLSSFIFSGIETPDGQTNLISTSPQDIAVMEYPNVVVSPTGWGSSHYELIVTLDVTAPNRVDLWPGHYLLQLAGAVVWDSGPWDLHLALPGH